MTEVKNDIWKFHTHGAPICITTNGFVNRYGACVMGRGIAQQAARKWPRLPFILGDLIKQGENHVYWIEEYDVFSFPVKHHWKQKADLELIQQSCLELTFLADKLSFPEIFMVRPGCGNGQLSWTQVQPYITPLLDDRFIVVEWA